mmetsp:Transcript_99145/g.280802  ORF Transcript_99145/g.280802 Transcript_99145/m.280802 type:complete len:293 (+) Transcript_99145:494-1372(+)
MERRPAPPAAPGARARRTAPRPPPTSPWRRPRRRRRPRASRSTTRSRRAWTSRWRSGAAQPRRATLRPSPERARVAPKPAGPKTKRPATRSRRRPTTAVTRASSRRSARWSHSPTWPRGPRGRSPRTPPTRRTWSAMPCSGRCCGGWRPRWPRWRLARRTSTSSGLAPPRAVRGRFSSPGTAATSCPGASRRRRRTRTGGGCSSWSAPPTSRLRGSRPAAVSTCRPSRGRPRPASAGRRNLMRAWRASPRWSTRRRARGSRPSSSGTSAAGSGPRRRGAKRGQRPWSRTSRP